MILILLPRYEWYGMSSAAILKLMKHSLVYGFYMTICYYSAIDNILHIADIYTIDL